MAKTNRDVTIYGRLSFPDLFTPRAANENSEPKYSATILIPKTDTDTIARIQEAIKHAVNDGVERRVFKQPIDPAHTKYPPLRDGDLPNDSGEARGPEYAGHWFISARASMKRKPFVVDQQVQPIIDETEIYAGCYCNFAIQFFAYENSGNKGIAASLVGVQKHSDGERLGGPAIEATDVFTAIGGAPAAPAAAPAAAPGLGF